MGDFDSMFDEETHDRIKKLSRRIHGIEDRKAFRDEVSMELWDFMPFSRREINRTINNVFRKYVSGDPW